MHGLNHGRNLQRDLHRGGPIEVHADVLNLGRLETWRAVVTS